ncbi:hypothetical protein EXT68_22475 [Pectobacterium parmentieri]|uniref:Immunity protein 35 domain-containing protein n=2 Tax=Pectobacterium parmentieri TaxID=1905730 RepID=A0ABS0S3X2_PECPM|nr:hypothetical protein [Pectobacterium parmentieri]MBI0495305.1 hypothetical protein [Pectobacterium parmentieri]MBI0556573.1 hypothetical protein [Pectobacterium parmentieri]MBI0569744.1 hypothetical protein [Pectobacterium parmentieri]MBI0574522.1 hypothetical protein [Pectobacterium parmentieri]
MIFMNKDELRDRLIKEKISRSLYSLDGGLPDEKLCLDRENGYWFIYYSERGIKTGMINFPTENEACQYIYDQINEIIIDKTNNSRKRS